AGTPGPSTRCSTRPSAAARPSPPVAATGWARWSSPTHHHGEVPGQRFAYERYAGDARSPPWVVARERRHQLASWAAAHPSHRLGHGHREQALAVPVLRRAARPALVPASGALTAEVVPRCGLVPAPR